MSREKWEKLENLRGERMAAVKISSVKKKLLHFHSLEQKATEDDLFF
jgi:hypothetical protein